MSQKVRKGDSILVDVNLEFTGIIRNYAILVENQYIPTTNDKAVGHQITLDGDPIQIKANFIGTQGSTIKKFEIKINSKIWKLEDIKFKLEGIGINIPVPYIQFDLKHIV